MNDRHENVNGTDGTSGAHQSPACRRAEAMSSSKSLPEARKISRREAHALRHSERPVLDAVQVEFYA
jgi:hypothetical protein